MKYLPNVKVMESPNQSGTIRHPSLIVLHYTASGEGNDAKYFQNKNARASAHLVIERDGTVTQCVPFDKKAWHAGVSTWRGRSNCNAFSIGIEIDNWGLLEKRADGTYRSHTGHLVPKDKVVEAPNKLGRGKYWEAYDDKQLDAVEKVLEQLVKAFPSIEEIVGHEDIAPRRKIDPGPGLYHFIDCMNNRFFKSRANDEPPKKKTVMAQPYLNVREGPGANYGKIDSVDYGKWVEVLNVSGDWSQIAWPPGWVHSGYLR